MKTELNYLLPPSEMQDDYLLTLAIELHARSCRPDCAQSLHERAVELRTELRSRLASLRKCAQRLNWLHDCSNGSEDAEGFEWGIYRVKWENGSAKQVWQTNSDFSDLDAEMERESKPALSERA